MDMNDRPMGSEMLQRYLLGDLNDEGILERIESRLISDDDFADEVEMVENYLICLLYTSPSPRDRQKSRMPSSA